MSKHEFDLELRAVNPVGRLTLATLDLATGEEALGRALMEEATVADGPELDLGRRTRPRTRRPRTLLGLAAGAAIVVAVVVLLLGGGRGPGSTTPAYGAQLVRFAESTPLLLLEGPEWGVRSVDQLEGGEGRIEFTRTSPDPHPDEPLETRSEAKRHITPPAVVERRQRRVELAWHDNRQYRLLWHDGKVGRSFYDEYLHKRIAVYERGPAFKTTIPSLGVTAYVAPRSENSREGGPGDRLMAAIWKEGPHLIELRASVPDLAGFRERLGWLRRVGAEEWLGAMPAKVVKAAEYGATVKAMLRGIPLPPGFDAASIRDLDLTTDRYQVGAQVGGAVACAWFHRWGEARADGDPAAAGQAERVLLASEKRWPIFREMASEGAYPATVVEYAEHMKSGVWFGKPLLAAVDGEGGICNDRP
jgi:hypothetical protein